MPVFGAQGAAELQGALISDTLRKVSTIEPLASLYVFFAGGSLPTGPRAGMRRIPAFGGDIPWSAGAFQPSVTVLRQRGRDLGERLEGAFRFLLRRHPAAVVIGTDSPLLSGRLLRIALGELRVCDAVLGPCPDGGYYLVGLRPGRPRRSSAVLRAPQIQASRFPAFESAPAGGNLSRESLFTSIRWSTPYAFRDTLRNLLAADCSCSLLQTVRDLDRPQDVTRLHKELARSQAARRLAPNTWRFLKAASRRRIARGLKSSSGGGRSMLRI